jgi:hypothetical protein
MTFYIPFIVLSFFQSRSSQHGDSVLNDRVLSIDRHVLIGTSGRFRVCSSVRTASHFIINHTIKATDPIATYRSKTVSSAIPLKDDMFAQSQLQKP